MAQSPSVGRESSSAVRTLLSEADELEMIDGTFNGRCVDKQNEHTIEFPIVFDPSNVYRNTLPRLGPQAFAKIVADPMRLESICTRWKSCPSNHRSHNRFTFRCPNLTPETDIEATLLQTSSVAGVAFLNNKIDR